MNNKNKRFTPDIMLTKKDGKMRIIDAPPSATQSIEEVYGEKSVPLEPASVIGLIFSEWMERGYSFGFCPESE